MIANLNGTTERTPERETSFSILERTGVIEFLCKRICPRGIRSLIATLNGIDNQHPSETAEQRERILDYIGKIAKDKTTAMIEEKLNEDWENVHPIGAYSLLTKYFSELKTQ